MRFSSVTALSLAGLAAAKKPSYEDKGSSSVSWETAYTATGTAAVAAAAATAKTSSPTSKVKGKAFDRIAFIWFENTDYDKAIGDPNFKKFAKQGITLDNYFAATHPSEPNYMSSIAGDYFGMENDNFNRANQNVTSVIDLLEHKGVSWGFYQEDMPYSGYEGFKWVNQKTGANDYVRKHNPGVLVDIVTRDEERLSQIKNLSLLDTGKSQFHKDLKADKLPQWMFITPNMTSDGHDSTITVAGKWLDAFLTPLLSDRNFLQNTLVVITFDENETYTIKNNILAILVGDAVPKHAHGSTDSNFYNHYSEIATVEANWDLPTLGRWDVGANVYNLVARHTGDKLRKYSATDLKRKFWNASYAGVFNEYKAAVYPAPNLDLDHSFSGRHVYDQVKKEWRGSNLPTYYKDTIQVNDGISPPKGFEPAESAVYP